VNAVADRDHYARAMATRLRPAITRTMRRLGAIDSSLLRRAVTARTPRTDAIMLAASTAANKSRLWFAASLVLVFAGGSRGRRAAARGLVAIALTSAVVNGPLKFVLRRSRPGELLHGGPALVPMPGSFSFPSGHAASAFAFATAVAREWPAVGIPLTGAAGAVAYSRVHNGVHFPSDVVVGAGLGMGAATAAGVLLRDDHRIPLPKPEPDTVPRRAILLTSATAGSADALDAARRALLEHGFEVVDEIPVEQKGKLADVVAMPADERPLVIAAGGDGTVGAAADELAGTGAIMAILPLGTSNDVARSLGIDPDPVGAASELADGVVRAIDTGQVAVAGRPPRNFVHAATVGINVRFAQLATQSALRRRLGRLTYAVAGVRAMRRHEPFDCELHFDDATERVRLVQLSVINAPVFGGALDLRIPRARMDDRSLVVIAIEDGSPIRLLVGALVALVARGHVGFGVTALRTKKLRVHVERELDMALDGEICARLPADFAVGVDALRVVTPRVKNDEV
jgi:undecaprenyl-diphosphatase